jgi:hypothetical protein
VVRFVNTARPQIAIEESENRVLRGILGRTRDEVVRGWRKLHNDELRNLHSSNIIILFKLRCDRQGM